VGILVALEIGVKLAGCPKTSASESPSASKTLFGYIKTKVTCCYTISSKGPLWLGKGHITPHDAYAYLQGLSEKRVLESSPEVNWSMGQKKVKTRAMV
jgi:hypothetical protein